MEERGCMVVITMAWQVLLIIVSIAFSRTPAKRIEIFLSQKSVEKGDWHIYEVFWNFYFTLFNESIFRSMKILFLSDWYTSYMTKTNKQRNDNCKTEQ